MGTMRWVTLAMTRPSKSHTVFASDSVSSGSPVCLAKSLSRKESSTPESIRNETGSSSCSHNRVPGRINLLAAGGKRRCNGPPGRSTGKPPWCVGSYALRRTTATGPAAWAPRPTCAHSQPQGQTEREAGGIDGAWWRMEGWQREPAHGAVVSDSCLHQSHVD